MLSQRSYSLQLIHQQDSICRNNEGDDPVERASRHLKAIIEQNDKLEQQIQNLKKTPKQFIIPIKNQLVIKINELKTENSNLKKTVDQSKMPVYSEMKKKSFLHIQRTQRDSVETQIRLSVRNSITGRSALSEINSNSNFDKNDRASTCFNEQLKQGRNFQQFNPILKLHKLSREEQNQRSVLTSQIQYLIAQTQIFQQKMEDIDKKQGKYCEKQKQKINQQQSQLFKIHDYKKKLLRILNKLKSREVQMEEILKIYKKIHEETLLNLQQATKTLQELQQQKIENHLEQKYAEVIQLEERLRIIDSELQEMNQEKWLEKVLRELTIIFRRLGISVPKSHSIRSALDQLCEILIENHLNCKQDHEEKLKKLRQYHEEQTSNNQKLIQNLKSKEQVLSKKLNNIQMQKCSNSKK